MASKKKSPALSANGDFDSLVAAIVLIHQQAQEFAIKAVNVGLTLRNWLIGHRIVEFEQNGADRAAYGESLMDTLSQRLASHGLPRVTPRELRRYRQLYQVYPRIWESVTPKSLGEAGFSAMLPLDRFLPIPSWESVTPESPIVEATTSQLIFRLSFTHLSELIQLPDETQRRFYEIESIRGNWSVRELRRQIASLYYERSGLSKDKAKLSAMAHAKAETLQPAQIIRDPYLFEFLGLRSRDVMGESDLEDALIDRLQDFLLEMGHGFCFEARQKRLLIGGEHFFVDLVFYHRVLKCHVLVELKTGAFSHEHLGQLNTYVAYYKKHEMTPGDQPPVGILLCTRKNEALVEFALGDLSSKIFVSRYAVEMPKKREMERFLREIGKEAGSGANTEGSLKSSGKSSLNSAAVRPAGNEKSREKGKEKSKGKILDLMAADPAITTKKIAGAIGLSTTGIEKAVRKLKQEGKLRRIGPDKGGCWEVLLPGPDSERNGAGHGG